MTSDDFQTKIRTVLTADDRYTIDAYRFVFEALKYTVDRIGEQRHVSGRELLDGIRDYAREEFGGLAGMVLREWGVCQTQDIGEIVFNLVDHGLMGKTETDTREDFRDVYRFEDAFPIDFAPPPEPTIS